MINKDTKIYCSFAREAGNVGCKLFNSAFNYYNIDAVYKSFSIKSIEKAVDAARTLDIKGFAITMPFKIEVLDYVDEVPYAVQDIGAANTVINNNGYLIPHNTDYLAVKEMLIDHVGSELYILGNGGYSKAVQSAAKSLNFDYEFITRSDWNEIEDLRDSVIFNCTPVENIKFDESNRFIDCLVKSETGKKLSWMQASHQFKLYTDKELSIRNI